MNGGIRSCFWFLVATMHIKAKEISVETHRDAENCCFPFFRFVLLAVAAVVSVRLILDVTTKNDADSIPDQQRHSLHIVEAN